MYDEVISLEKGYSAFKRELFKLCKDGKVNGIVFVGITKTDGLDPEEVHLISCLQGTQYHKMQKYEDYCYFTHQHSYDDVMRFVSFGTRPDTDER
jgi:hypothetical protein